MPTIRELENITCPSGHLITTVKVAVPDRPRPTPGQPKQKVEVDVVCPQCGKEFKVILRD